MSWLEIIHKVTSMANSLAGLMSTMVVLLLLLAKKAKYCRLFPEFEKWDPFGPLYRIQISSVRNFWTMYMRQCFISLSYISMEDKKNLIIQQDDNDHLSVML